MLSHTLCIGAAETMGRINSVSGVRRLQAQPACTASYRSVASAPPAGMHDSQQLQTNFPRTNTSVPSEWVPPKIAGAAPAEHGEWIVPGVHVLWGDDPQMRLRRRTKLLWASPPRTVLLVKKWGDAKVTAQMLDIAAWLTVHGARVLVEENVQPEMPDYELFSAVTQLPQPDFAGTGALAAQARCCCTACTTHTVWALSVRMIATLLQLPWAGMAHCCIWPAFSAGTARKALRVRLLS